MRPEIFSRRCTLFCDVQNKVDESNYLDYIEAMKGLGVLPSLNKGIHYSIKAGDVTTTDVYTLNFTSNNDQTFRTSISNGRIDILSINSQMQVDSFVEKVSDVSDALKKKCIGGYTRYALYSVAKFEFNAEQINDVYSLLVNCENCETPIEWSIKKVLKNGLNIDGKTIEMNNVITIYRKGISEQPKTLQNDAIYIEMDINTDAKANVDKLDIHTDVFLSEASKKIEEILENYTKVFNK